MKKNDKRVIWMLSADGFYSDGRFALEFIPEENPFGHRTSEPIIKIKYGRTTWLKEAESATTVYRMKIPRGRPRRAE